MREIPSEVIKLASKHGINFIRKSPVEHGETQYFVGLQEMHMIDDYVLVIKYDGHGEPETIEDLDEVEALIEEENEYMPDETDPDYDDFEWNWENI